MWGDVLEEDILNGTFTACLIVHIELPTAAMESSARRGASGKYRVRSVVSLGD